MTLPELPFPHRRGIEKLVQRFQVSRRGGLFLCVGACQDTTHRVVAAMQSALGADEVAALSLPPDEPDPWATILATRAHPGQLIVARLADDTSTEVLRKLDIQRELLHQERVVLLLWVSLEQLRSLADQAPNLWSVRRDVVWFISPMDMERSAVRLASGVSASNPIDHQLSQIDAELDWKAPGSDPDLLLRKAWLLTRLGAHQASREMLLKMRPSIEGDREREWDWEMRLLSNHLIAHDIDGLLSHASGVPRSIYEAEDDTYQRAIFAAKHEFAPLFESLTALAHESNLPRLHPNRLMRWFHLHAIALSDGAGTLVGLGRISSARRWLKEIENSFYTRMVADSEKSALPGGSHWPAVAIFMAEAEAFISWELLQTISSLEHSHLSALLADRLGFIDTRAQMLEWLIYRYASLGYRAEVHQLARQYVEIREVLAHTREASWIDEHPSLDAPFDRLTRAVRKAEQAIERGDLTAVASAFQECEQAWEDEDPRYRSLYLLARWKKVEARWLVARGEAEQAVTVLRETMAESLAELPRTRLDMLVALAQLGPSVDGAVREAAAEEALTIALTAEALSVERDARRVLAPFARERGDEKLALFHEEEARKIDEALAEAPPENPVDHSEIIERVEGETEASSSN